MTAFHDRPNRVFYWALAPLTAFFLFFGAVLLPNASWLHPTAAAASLAASLPEGLTVIVNIFANWTCAPAREQRARCLAALRCHLPPLPRGGGP